MRARWMAMVGLAAAANFSAVPSTSSAQVRAETPAAQLEKGVFQQETAGDLDAAVKVYRRIVDEANANRRFVAEAQFRIGECYQKQGKKAEAEAAFRQVIAVYPDQAELVGKARKQLGETEPVNAQAESLSSNPQIEAALNKKVNLFGPVYPSSYPSAPTDKLAVQYAVIEIARQAGLEYNWNESFKNTDPICRQWVRPNVRDQACKDALRQVLGPVGLTFKIENGQIVLFKAGQDRKAAENLGAEGWRLWGQRKLAEAEAKFAEAVKLDPTNANCWNGLGWAQMNQGKPLNAQESFEKCVALDPKAAAALTGLGWIAKGAGKTDEAMDWWKKAIEAAPNTTAALSGLASTSMELKQYDQAAQYYQMWLKAEPDNADAKLGLEKAKTAAQSVKTATPPVEKWLAALEAGKYADCWEQSAAMMRNAVAKTDFEAGMKKVLTPFGKVVSRKLLSTDYTKSLPGAPDGEYVVMRYQTDFESKKGAVETITPMKEPDGQWRVSGYYVK